MGINTLGNNNIFKPLPPCLFLWARLAFFPKISVCHGRIRRARELWAPRRDRLKLDVKRKRKKGSTGDTEITSARAWPQPHVVGRRAGQTHLACCRPACKVMAKWRSAVLRGIRALCQLLCWVLCTHVTSFDVYKSIWFFLYHTLWAESCPLNSYVEVLTPSISECDCIWRRDL